MCGTISFDAQVFLLTVIKKSSKRHCIPGICLLRKLNHLLTIALVTVFHKAGEESRVVETKRKFSYVKSHLR